MIDAINSPQMLVLYLTSGQYVVGVRAPEEEPSGNIVLLNPMELIVVPPSEKTLTTFHMVPFATLFGIFPKRKFLQFREGTYYCGDQVTEDDILYTSYMKAIQA